MTPTLARRIAYRTIRRQGLDPARARELVSQHMHPERALGYTANGVEFAAQCAAIRALKDLNGGNDDD